MKCFRNYFDIVVAALVAMLGMTFTTTAQNTQNKQLPCTLTVTQSPKIRDLRLGMSLDEAITILPTIKTNHAEELIPSDVDTVHVMLLPKYDDYDGKLEDIDYLSLSFVDNRLFDIAVTYTLSWPTIDEFALKISETLNLPTSWESGYEGRFRILNCDGFQVAVTKPEQPYLTLLIPDIAEHVKKRASLPPEERLKEKKERERIKVEAEVERKRQLKKAEDERKRRTFHP